MLTATIILTIGWVFWHRAPKAPPVTEYFQYLRERSLQEIPSDEEL